MLLGCVVKKSEEEALSAEMHCRPVSVSKEVLYLSCGLQFLVFQNAAK